MAHILVLLDSDGIGCCLGSRVSLKPSLRRLALNRCIWLSRCWTGRPSSEAAVRGGWHFKGGWVTGERAGRDWPGMRVRGRQGQIVWAFLTLIRMLFFITHVLFQTFIIYRPFIQPPLLQSANNLVTSWWSGLVFQISVPPLLNFISLRSVEG